MAQNDPGVGLIDVIAGIANPAPADTVQGRGMLLDNRARGSGSRGSGRGTPESLLAAGGQQGNPIQAEIDRLMAMQAAGQQMEAPAPGGQSVDPEQGQLMEMMLGALMDPKIKADDVGSQLMQMITMDALGGGQQGGSTPKGLSGFLKNILGNMAAEQAPNTGGRSNG